MGIYNRGGGGGMVDFGTFEDITSNCVFDTTNGTFSHAKILVNEKLKLMSGFLQFDFLSYPSGFATNAYKMFSIPSKYEFENVFVEMGQPFDDVYNAPVMSSIGVAIQNFSEIYGNQTPTKSKDLYLSYNLAGISSYKLKSARVSFFQPIKVN